MANQTFQVTLSKPHVFLLRMLLFLGLAAFLALILIDRIQHAFMTNPGLNALILAVLFIGIIHSFRQIIRLYPEVRWINNFGTDADTRPPHLLAPMATMLSESRGNVSLSAISMRTLMDSIGIRLDEAHETSRYLVGLLIFLGLLGTFWGLLGTISSVGDTIDALNTTAGNNVTVFEDLKRGLKAPLLGMGTAFSSSLFGLAGSLILGFLDLQANQAQNRFYNELEDWLSGITQLAPQTRHADEPVADHVRHALSDVRQNVPVAQTGAGPQSDVVMELAKGIDGLVMQIRQEQGIMRQWVEDQAAQQGELAALLKRLDIAPAIETLSHNQQALQNWAQAQSSQPAEQQAADLGQIVAQMRAEQQTVRQWIDQQATLQGQMYQLLQKLNAQLEG